MDRSQYELLTPTEREVLRRIGGGSRPGEVARGLERSVSTINNHLQSARSKLGVPDSLTAGRALLSFEAAGQSVPRQEMPMAPAPPPRVAVVPQDMTDPTLILLNEADPTIGGAPLRDRHPAGDRAGDMDGGTLDTTLSKVGTVLGLTLLIVALIALAPAMANTFQRVIDLIYPIKD